MIRIFRSLLKHLISILDILVPKKSGLWVFYITPNTSWDANMQCVYALAKKKTTANCVVVYLNPLTIPSNIETTSVSFTSLKGFWYCLRSEIFFFDHALAPGITRFNRKNINLWHGIPIKNIRFFCKDSFPPGYLKHQSKHTSLLIASSAIDRLAMAASFQVSPEKVVVTGLPRNDILLGKDSCMSLLPSLLEEHEELNQLKNERLFVLYAPTYRDRSGVVESVVFNRQDEELFGSVLQKYNAVLGVREHPFSSGDSFPYLHECGLAVNVPTQSFSNTNIVLSIVDVLITDYSSIWVDYLLIKKPILGFCPDLDEYYSMRGFIYDFKEIFPGDITTSISELAAKIDQILSSKEHKLPNKQKMVFEQFHKYDDGNNTERVLEIIQNNV